jgi:uncharacterized protein (TIGR02145 family)
LTCPQPIGLRHFSNCADADTSGTISINGVVVYSFDATFNANDFRTTLPAKNGDIVTIKLTPSPTYAGSSITLNLDYNNLNSSYIKTNVSCDGSIIFNYTVRCELGSRGDDIFITSSCVQCPNCCPEKTPWVQIGNQKWTACNLGVTTYRDGTEILYAGTDAEWKAAGDAQIGAWCWAGNQTEIDYGYGKLYNWYAVTNSRNLAPVGYHVPSDGELNQLRNNLGGESLAGGRLKEPGFCHWNSPNNGIINSTGFNAVGAGYREPGGAFKLLRNVDNFFSSNTAFSDFAAWNYGIYTQSSLMVRGSGFKTAGLSVRLVKD